MRKLLIQISVFVAVISVVCVITSAVFEKKAKECTDKTPYAKINEVIGMKDVDADLIVLGNSRAEGGYDVSLMTSLCGMKCLNLGNGGFPFDYAYHIMYENYIRQNKKPKYVIVEVDPWAFFDHVASVYTIQMLPYISRPEFQFYIDMCPQLSNADKMLFFRYFGKMGKVLKEIDYLKQPVQEKKGNRVKWPKNYFGKLHKLECNKAIVELFARFLCECKEQDIAVILVCSPFHVEDGLSYFDMDGFWNIVKWCRSGTGCTIISYQDYFGSDTTYFSDPAHLNCYGKEIFTKKLCHDLDSLGILSNHFETRE